MWNLEEGMVVSSATETRTALGYEHSSKRQWTF